MAFRLQNRAPADDGLRRVVRKEFRKARLPLSGRPEGAEAVHEARKSVKKIRAVLRLLRSDLGPHYRTENRKLRSAAHCLSPLRDADAMVETLRALRSRYPLLVTASVERRVMKGLRGLKRQASRSAESRVRRAAKALRRSEGTAPDRIRRAARLSAVRAGMTRDYRRARKAMKPLGVASDATQLHAWRRRVKAHTYQVRLLEGFHPSARARAARLGQLEDWLGEDHNQAVLRGLILGAPERFGDARTTAIVLGSIVRYQAWLRSRALALGRRLFAARPTEFRDSVDAWWRSGHEGSRR
jgi:CHAD domain-containing protein